MSDKDPIIGYRMKEPEGSFYDPVLRVALSRDQVAKAPSVGDLRGTFMDRCIRDGGLVAVHKSEDSKGILELKGSEPTPAERLDITVEELKKKLVKRKTKTRKPRTTKVKTVPAGDSK